MCGYMTRVVLHDADEKDYRKLNDLMNAADFTQIISGNDDLRYDLPPAQYISWDAFDMTAEEMRARASSVVDQVGKRNAVLTCRTDDMAFIGLPRAKTATA